MHAYFHVFAPLHWKLPYMGGKTPGAGLGQMGSRCGADSLPSSFQMEPSRALLMRHYLLTGEHMRGISTFRKQAQIPISKASLARIGPGLGLPSDPVSPSLCRSIPPDSLCRPLIMKARESTRKDCDCGKTNSVLMLKKRGRLEKQDKMNGVCGFLSSNKKIAFKFGRMTPYRFGNHKAAE